MKGRATTMRQSRAPDFCSSSHVTVSSCLGSSKLRPELKAEIFLAIASQLLSPSLPSPLRSMNPEWPLLIRRSWPSS